MLSKALSIFAMSASMLALSSTSAFAEGTLSIYGGANFSPHSSVTYNDGVNATRDITPGWDGASFEAPPYYGIRATWWLEERPQVGIAFDFTHSKVKAKNPQQFGFGVLEFTDGINFFTANALYRWDLENGFKPYVGIGAGLSVPKVEVTDAVVNTNEYQVTGAAVQALIGVDYKINEDWSVFGELKSTYGQVDADLNTGGSLETNIISNQVIVGVTYKFW